MRVTVRVVVADDSYLLRQGVVRLVDAEPELEVVGVAGSLDELLEVVERVAARRRHHRHPHATDRHR